MALVKNTNSYVTVAEADAYFADRLSNDVWSVLSPEKKAQSLVAATEYIDGLRWKGSAVDSQQALAFPRVGSYYDAKLGAYQEMNPTPSRVITSVYETAMHLVKNEGVQEANSVIKGLKVGPIELTDIRAVSVTSPVVSNLLRDMLDNSGRTWWRAN